MLRRLSSALLHRAFPGLPAPTHRYEIRRNIPVPMTDGTPLLGDLYLPAGSPTAGPVPPTVLIRSPYGRAGIGSPICRLLAEQGFPVFSQSCRGTAGSGGAFVPQLHEKSDGIDTHRWVRAQPWFTGRLVTTGQSYLGYTQWAVAGYLSGDEAPDAVCLQVTMPDFGAITWDNGAFSLRNALSWSTMMSQRDRFAAGLRQFAPDKRLEAAFDHLPLTEGDRASTGRTIGWYQDWVNRDDLSDEYWTEQSHTASVPAVTAPVSMITGWYDIFLPWQMRTYRQLVEAGNPPELTVGPWGHASAPLMRNTPAEVYDFLRHHLLDGPDTRPDPVKVFVTGADEWRGYPEWPPPAVADTTWLLQPEGGLSTWTPPASAPSRYVYDPADPTPSLGGPALAPKCGPVDNSAHESRSDVLTFTSAPLDDAVEVLGEPVATIALRSDREHTDLFVRICDVHPDGRSWTVCDGIRRIGGRGTAAIDPKPDDRGVREVSLPLWPTAHRFRPGHRIRLQVSSGAHPRYARNTGADEPDGIARTLHRAHQEIFHDPAHRSWITLPTLPRP